MSQDLSPLAKPQEPELLHELRALIHAVRSRIATAVNAELTLLHWRIGKRLLAENLHQGRAEYGQQILASLAQELAAEFGKGFSYSALTRMVRFAELFPEERIVASLVQVLSWTHILALIPLKDGMAREFYAEMCRVERWSVRTLRKSPAAWNGSGRCRLLSAPTVRHAIAQGNALGIAPNTFPSPEGA